MSYKSTPCPTLSPVQSELLCNSLKEYGLCEQIGCPACPGVSPTPLPNWICDDLKNFDIEGCYGCKSTPDPTEYPIYCKINQISLKDGKINYKCPWVIFWIIISSVTTLIVLVYFLTFFYALFLSPYK